MTSNALRWSAHHARIQFPATHSVINTAVDDRLVGAASSVNSLPGIMEEDLRPAEHGI